MFNALLGRALGHLIGDLASRAYAVTAADAGDGGLRPRLFLALTVQVYVLLALRALTVSGLAAPDADLVTPRFDDVQVAV